MSYYCKDKNSKKQHTSWKRCKTTDTNTYETRTKKILSFNENVEIYMQHMKGERVFSWYTYVLLMVLGEVLELGDAEVRRVDVSLRDLVLNVGHHLWVVQVLVHLMDVADGCEQPLDQFVHLSSQMRRWRQRRTEQKKKNILIVKNKKKQNNGPAPRRPYRCPLWPARGCSRGSAGTPRSPE